jgi:hypothetical protein
MLTGRQIAAARTLVGLTQADLASRANISVPTLKRMEGSDGIASGMTNNLAAVRTALEAAGVVFVDGAYSGSGGPGVRLASPAGPPKDTDESETIQYPEFLQGDGGPGSGG